jgi:hypothetical protein
LSLTSRRRSGRAKARYCPEQTRDITPRKGAIFDTMWEMS